MDSFGKEALEAHNRFRAAHQAPSLTWSSALARDAEAWAKQIAREGRLRHDDTKDGENVFMVFGREIDGADAVNSWYSEVKNYDFCKPGFQSNTGHFTQVVWKGSKELGIGKAKSADGKVFVVGRYRPAGNNMRAFEENVFPSKVREAEEMLRPCNSAVDLISYFTALSNLRQVVPLFPTRQKSRLPEEHSSGLRSERDRAVHCRFSR